jgi:hypothetical protein
MSSLVEDYESQKMDLYNIYNSVLGPLVDSHTRKSLDRLIEIRNLRKEVPELFVTGYSRECFVKPYIVSEDRALVLEKEGRKTMKYPKNGEHSRIYVCPIGYYPGLKRNRLQNRSLFEYLPACYITDHSLNPNSNYSNYYSSSVTTNSFQTRNELNARIQQVDILLPGERGDIPIILQKIMYDNRREYGFRVGSSRTKSSFMECVHNCLNPNNKFTVSMRNSIDFNPVLCLQELWYMSSEEILCKARDPNVFMDPILYVRALETVYNVNIYTFNMVAMNSKKKLSLSIASCPPPYIWEPISGPSIIILCYRECPDFPHCEYIRINRSQSLRMEEYKKDFLSIIKGPVPVKPSGGLSQCIDKYGKCTSVKTDSRIIECFWRPLDLPLEDTSERIYMNTYVMYRKKAYFICDILSIIKSLDSNVEKYIELSYRKVDFTPFVIREKFHDVKSCIDYYRERNPSMFNGTKIIISHSIYSELIRFLSSFEYCRLFSRVLDTDSFKQRDKTRIIIRRRGL